MSAAYIRCSIKVAVGSLNQRGIGFGAVGNIEVIKCRELARGGDLIQRAGPAIGILRCRAIKVAIGALNRRANGYAPSVPLVKLYSRVRLPLGVTLNTVPWLEAPPE